MTRMDPMVQAKIEQIEAQLTGLRETLEKNRTELAKQHGEKEELLQEKWRDRKKMTTLNRMSKEYDELESENRKYAVERKELRERLTGLLRMTKALRGSMRT